MILSGPTIKKLRIVQPYCPRTVQRGMSYGESYAGYDIRIDQDATLGPKGFKLASSMEKFTMPSHVLALIKDKSTWARRGLSVFNTVIEPGWTGYLTMELFNAGDHIVQIHKGDPIAQVIFYGIDAEVKGYEGKYQDQEARPVEARDERLEEWPIG